MLLAGGWLQCPQCLWDSALARVFEAAYMLTQRQDRRGFRGPKRVSQKIQEIFDSGVDTARGPRLYTPHNEGGAPLATEEFALVKSKRAA